jgi:O-antigen ligase
LSPAQAYSGWRHWPILILGAVFIGSLQLPGTVALRLSLLVLLALLALPDLARLRALPRSIVIAIVAWVAVSALSLVNAIDPNYSVREFKNELGYTLAAFLVFFTLAASIQRVLVWRNTFLAATLVLGVVAVVWHFLEGVRVHGGPHGGPGTLTTFLLVALPLLVLAGVPGWRGSLPRWPVALGVLIWLAAAWASENRIVWVIALIASFFMLGMRYRDAAKHGGARFGRQQWLIVAALVLVFAAAFATSQAKRFTGATVDSAIARIGEDPRVRIWSAALQTAKRAPWTGFGVGRGVQGVEIRAQSKDPMGWHGHNILLDYYISLGPAGPVVLLLLFGSLIAAQARSLNDPEPGRRLLALAGITMIGAFFLRSMVDDFFYRHNAILFWSWNGILLGFLTTLRKGRNQ